MEAKAVVGSFMRSAVLMSAIAIASDAAVHLVREIDFVLRHSSARLIQWEKGGLGVLEAPKKFKSTTRRRTVATLVTRNGAPSPLCNA